jgi:predicted amidohydrolase YtcJ
MTPIARHVASAALFLATGAALAAPAQTIYVGGDILTMKGPAPVYAEALAVRDGKIAAVGRRAAVMALKGPGTEVVDLKGATLMPGFIDAHGHVGLAIQWQQYAWLRKPEIDSIPKLLDALREHVKKMGLKPGDWIVGNGYDPSLLAEKRHPTAAELDTVSTDSPTLLIHASGHAGVANSSLLQRRGIGPETPDPEGGAIGRIAGSRMPNGLLEEVPFIALLRAMPPLTSETAPRYVKAGMDEVARTGITTVREDFASITELALLGEAARAKQLPIDVIVHAVDAFGAQLTKLARAPSEVPIREVLGSAVPIEAAAERAMREAPEYTRGYVNRLRIAGVKFHADGAPSAGTAYLLKPYSARFPGKDAGYAGIPTLTAAQWDAIVDTWYPSRFQMLVHANGDAAIQQMIDAIGRARKKHGVGDRRPVIIHAGMASEAQVRQMKGYGIVPSFYSSMVAVGAQVYEANIGERVRTMQPAGYAERLGMRFTIHNDSPLVPWDILPLVQSAVTRRNDVNGQVYGPELRITRYQALLAVTRHAAWQAFEEATKGTLEPGKRADLVVLDRDPLKVRADEIRTIKVMRTIKDGETVFVR